MKNILYFSLLICLVLSCQSETSPDNCAEDSFGEGNYTLLKDATLFSGMSETVLANYSVLVKDEMIIDVAPDSAICVPNNAKVIALEGRLISPGLIESHGHQIFNESWDTTKVKLERLVYSGITGIRNMAGSVPSYNEWSKKIAAGQAIGPNIYSSAFFAGQEFFNVDARLQKYRDYGYEPGDEDWMKIVNDGLDIPEAVLRAKNSGATGIKLYASLKPEWIRTIVEEANRQNLKVWSHAHLQFTETQEIVDLDIHSISHAEMLAHTISEANEVLKNHDSVDTVRVKSIFNKMIDHEIFFDVTLALYYKYYGGDSDRAKFATQIVEMTLEAGVPIVAGSDSEGFWNEGDIALYDEIITLVEEAGMSNSAALQSATYNPARLLGIDDEYGAISVGKKADIVAYDLNPLDDIRNISQIYLAMKDGLVYSK